jgi:hypothetical protein
MPQHRAATAEQQEATAWVTPSGEAAYAPVLDSSNTVAVRKYFFILVSIMKFRHDLAIKGRGGGGSSPLLIDMRNSSSTG